MKYIITQELYQNMLKSCGGSAKGKENKDQAIIDHLNETCGLLETITEISVD